MARLLYVVLDGVGDLPTPSYGNKTPLEAASTTNLDNLAASGQMGIVWTVRRGIAPESDAGVFSLLSYNPLRLTLSRGVVEAIGVGMNFEDGDLALRCNFATVQNGELIDRRAGRNVSDDEAKALAASINRDSQLGKLADFELKSTIGHRCALVIRDAGMKLSGAISNLDPAYARSGNVSVAKSDLKLPAPIPACNPQKRTRPAIRTARLLNEFAHRVYQVLEQHPVNARRKARGYLAANFLLMRDAGTEMPSVRTLRQKFGYRSIALADMPVELGIAKVVGMDTVVFPPDRSTEAYSRRANKANELADRYDLVYVHLKGPDEPGHDGNFDGKRKSIEDIDSGFFANLAKGKHEFICITADHATPCIAKAHTDNPVPLLITGPRINSNGSLRFTEFYAAKGKLGPLRHGYEILPLVNRLMKTHGTHLTRS